MKTTLSLTVSLLLVAPLLADEPSALSLPPGATPAQARMVREYSEGRSWVGSSWVARHGIAFVDSGDATFLLAKVRNHYVVGDADGRPLCEITLNAVDMGVQRIVSIKRVGEALRVEYTTKGKPCCVSTPVFGLPEGVQVDMHLEGTLSKKHGRSYEPWIIREALRISPSGRYKVTEQWSVDPKTGALEGYSACFRVVGGDTDLWHSSPTNYCVHGTRGGESRWYRCGGYEVLVKTMVKDGARTELQVLRMGADRKPLLIFSGEWAEPKDSDPASLHWSHSAPDIGKGVLDLKLQWRTRNGAAASKDVPRNILSPERSEPYFDQHKN